MEELKKRMADRQVPGADRRRRSDRGDDLHHRASAGQASGPQRLDPGRRAKAGGSASSTASSTFISRATCSRRSTTRSGPTGCGDAFGAEQGLKALRICLRLARSESARYRMGSRRHIHARRLRRRSRAFLCRLGRRDRRCPPAAEGLSRAAARPPGGARTVEGARPTAPISRSARPTAIKRTPATSCSS